MQTLRELLSDIDTLSDDDTIFARPPWTAGSPARLVRPLEPDLEWPADATEGGFTYFLEVHVAREVLDWFRSHPETPLEERVERVIHYAQLDA